MIFDNFDVKRIKWPSLYVAFVTLFTSWTVYYSLPFEQLFQISVILLIIFKYRSNSQLKSNAFIAFFLISLWYFLPMDLDLKGCINGLFRSLTISSLFLLRDDYLKKAFDYLLDLIAIIAGIGAAFHVLWFMGIYSLPLITTVELGGRLFEVYPLCVYIVPSSMRFSSIFDEPGFLGTIVVLGLALDNFNLKKLRNIVLIICGIVTLSFAFYAMLAVMVVIVSLKGGNYKLPIAVAVIIGIMAYYLPDFFELITERNEIATLGTGAGFHDSRGGVAGAIEKMEVIANRPFLAVLFGNGYDSYLKIYGDNVTGIATSSVFRLIFQMGYVGLFALIVFMLKRVRKDFYAILFICFFIFSLYQRPHIFEMIYILILANAFIPKSSISNIE